MNLDTLNGNECEIHIERSVGSFQLSIIRIRVDETQDISITPSEELVMRNDRVSLEVLNSSIGSGAVQFLHTGSLGQKHVTFDFRYYLNYYYKENDDEHDGGLYIFKSTINESLPYNHTVSGIHVFRGSLLQMMVITYNSTMNPYQMTSVKLRLARSSDPFSEQIEFDVYLEGIEYMPGLDVTVNWKCKEMDSGGIFYTDSNALEMVKREADNYYERYQGTTT